MITLAAFAFTQNAKIMPASYGYPWPSRLHAWKARQLQADRMAGNLLAYVGKAIRGSRHAEDNHFCDITKFSDYVNRDSTINEIADQFRDAC